MSLALPSRALPSRLPPSRRLPSRLLPPGSCQRPIDPTAVTLQLVRGLLVAGDVHQLQVLRSEEQAVEVLPVHLPPVLDRLSQRGYHGALLLYSAKLWGRRQSFCSECHTPQGAGHSPISHRQSLSVDSVYCGRQPCCPNVTRVRVTRKRVPQGYESLKHS